jgi:hypothetical protein
MRFNLTSPCSNCPFRSDRPFPLLRGKVLEIRDALQERTFACHKTVDYDQYNELEDQEGDETVVASGPSHRSPKLQHCAGALILKERLGERGQMAQIAERLGLYHPERLDLEAPVYETWDAMLVGTQMGSGA